MPGISKSKKACCACAISCFSLLNTKCTYTKHDQLAVLSCIVNICWVGEVEMDVCMSDDHFQVCRGQTLKLLYLELLKLVRYVQLSIHFLAEDCVICNCIKILDKCNNCFHIQKTYCFDMANYRFLLYSLVKIPSRQQHMLDLLTR